MAQKIKKMSKKFVAFVCMFTLVFSYSVIGIDKSEAATAVTLAKLTLADSRTTNATGDYTLTFTQSSSTTIKCVKVVFATTATGSTLPTGMDTSTSEANVATGWAGLTEENWTIASTVDGTITWTYATGTAPASGNVTMVFDGITNPSSTATAYAQISTFDNVDCASSDIDTGVAAVAYFPAVTVSATVSESLSFAVTGVSNGDCDGSFNSAADLGGPANTTATAIDFSTLAAINTFYHGCQDLTVSTNAEDGYTVTLHELTSLMSGALTINESTGDDDLMDFDTSSAWQTEANNAGFGYACDDQTGTDCTQAAETTYLAVPCIGDDASCDPGSGGEAAQSIMTNAGPVDANVSRIEYKLTIDGTQEPGDYTNTLMYIATPTF